MAKKWYGIEKLVDREEEVKKDLQILMQEKPNFNKSKEGAKKIFQKKEYAILQAKKGYIVYNANKHFEEGHTHLTSFNMCKIIINNCISRKIPKTSNLYLLESHIRISKDKKYIERIEELIQAKESKDRLKYRNKNINSKKK